jgi:integrase
MRWELVEIGENPMKLVRVRGGSKRQKQPMVLTITQFQRLIKELDDPYRTMVILDLATGLRYSELFALKWRDVILDDLLLLCGGAIVDTIVSDVKTEYCRAGMPLDPPLAEVLLNWPRDTIQQARRLDIRESFQGRHSAVAALESATETHWTSVRPLRHRPYRLAHIPPHFRSLLDETGARMKVQQELMRHSDVRTTMNIYGKAMEQSKRDAHRRLVRLVLPARVA